MTVPPDAEPDHGVDACVYDRAALITDAEIEEADGLDYRYRERGEKEEEGGEKGSEDRKESG